MYGKMKLQQSNKQFFITLPKQIVEAKNWKKGDKILIELDKHGDIILKKAYKTIFNNMDKQPENEAKSSHSDY